MASKKDLLDPINRHIKRVSKTHYQCLICLKVLSKKCHARRHIQLLHSESIRIMKRLFVCPVCGKIYHSSTGCTSHLTSTHNQDKYTCPDPTCTKTFELTLTLQSHMNNKHKGTKVNKCHCNKIETKVAHLLCYQRKVNQTLVCTKILPKKTEVESISYVNKVTTNVKLLNGQKQKLLLKFRVVSCTNQRPNKKYFLSGHPKWITPKMYKSICKLQDTSTVQSTDDQLLWQDLDMSTSTSCSDTSAESNDSKITDIPGISMPTLDV